MQELRANGRILDVCSVCSSPVASATPVPAAPPSRPSLPSAVAPTAQPPADVLAVVRNRLDAVRAKIEDTRALEAEAAMLERMLEAAEPKPGRPTQPFTIYGGVAERIH